MVVFQDRIYLAGNFQGNGGSALNPYAQVERLSKDGAVDWTAATGFQRPGSILDASNKK